MSEINIEVWDIKPLLKFVHETCPRFYELDLFKYFVCFCLWEKIVCFVLNYTILSYVYMYYYNVFHSQFLQHTLKTALHEAVFYESRDIVEILLYFGAEPTLKDKVYSFVLFALFQALERTGFLVLFCFVLLCFVFHSSNCCLSTAIFILVRLCLSQYTFISVYFSPELVCLCARAHAWPWAWVSVHLSVSVCACLQVYMCMCLRVISLY